MSKKIMYRGTELCKGSMALELWEVWQKDKSPERNKIQQKLDNHMKETEKQYLALHGEPFAKAGWAIGASK